MQQEDQGVRNNLPENKMNFDPGTITVNKLKGIWYINSIYPLMTQLDYRCNVLDFKK